MELSVLGCTQLKNGLLTKSLPALENKQTFVIPHLIHIVFRQHNEDVPELTVISPDPASQVSGRFIFVSKAAEWAEPSLSIHAFRLVFITLTTISLRKLKLPSLHGHRV